MQFSLSIMRFRYISQSHYPSILVLYCAVWHSLVVLFKHFKKPCIPRSCSQKNIFWWDFYQTPLKLCCVLCFIKRTLAKENFYYLNFTGCVVKVKKANHKMTRWDVCVCNLSMYKDINIRPHHEWEVAKWFLVHFWFIKNMQHNLNDFC